MIATLTEFTKLPKLKKSINTIKESNPRIVDSFDNKMKDMPPKEIMDFVATETNVIIQEIQSDKSSLSEGFQKFGNIWYGIYNEEYEKNNELLNKSLIYFKNSLIKNLPQYTVVRDTGAVTLNNQTIEEFAHILAEYENFSQERRSIVIDTLTDFNKFDKDILKENNTAIVLKKYNIGINDSIVILKEKLSNLNNEQITGIFNSAGQTIIKEIKNNSLQLKEGFEKFANIWLAVQATDMVLVNGLSDFKDNIVKQLPQYAEKWSDGTVSLSKDNIEKLAMSIISKEQCTINDRSLVISAVTKINKLSKITELREKHLSSNNVNEVKPN